MNFSYRDKNGAVELTKRDQIIVVTLSGACGTRLINFYSKKLQELAKSYQHQPWAYLCNGKSFEATTPEAQKVIIKTYDACMKLGCRFEAYCYDSAIGKAQTQQIMQACGNMTDIEQVLFATEQQAQRYLLNQLAELSRTQKSNQS